MSNKALHNTHTVCTFHQISMWIKDASHGNVPDDAVRQPPALADRVAAVSPVALDDVGDGAHLQQRQHDLHTLAHHWLTQRGTLYNCLVFSEHPVFVLLLFSFI